jgi:hypothetical protein
MKTAKSIIVVLFVLLTAQIASAYYCPSTGRWLSRDPIGEAGFQASQMANLPSGIGNSVLQSSGRWVNRDPLQQIGFSLLRNGAQSALRKSLKINYFRGLSEPNLYGFVVNNPTDLFDLNGLSAADVSNITAAFMKLLKDMCQEKTCCPEIGWGQNLLPGYKGCRKQASQAEGVFDSLHYQDMWDISINYQQLPPHNTVDIAPRNPDDPSINIDTWRGCITYTYPPGSSTGTSYKSCWTCYSILNPTPPFNGCSTCSGNPPTAF